jgi:hypothetical protein
MSCEYIGARTVAYAYSCSVVVESAHEWSMKLDLFRSELMRWFIFRLPGNVDRRAFINSSASGSAPRRTDRLADMPGYESDHGDLRQRDSSVGSGRCRSGALAPARKLP